MIFFCIQSISIGNSPRFFFFEQQPMINHTNSIILLKSPMMVESPTPKGKFFVYSLFLVAFFQLVTIVLCFMSSQYFLKQGIIGILLVILLLVGAFKLSYQALMIHAFASIFYFITFLVFLLTLAQNGTEIEQDFIFHFVVGVCCCIFYFFTSIFMFFPYREFKAIEFEQNPALAEFIQNSCSNIQQRKNQEIQNRNSLENQQDINSLGNLPQSLNLRKTQSNRYSLRNLSNNRNSLPQNRINHENVVPTTNSIELLSPNKKRVEDSPPNIDKLDNLPKQTSSQEHKDMFGLK